MTRVSVPQFWNMCIRLQISLIWQVAVRLLHVSILIFLDYGLLQGFLIALDTSDLGIYCLKTSPRDCASRLHELATSQKKGGCSRMMWLVLSALCEYIQSSSSSTAGGYYQDVLDALDTTQAR